MRKIRVIQYGTWMLTHSEHTMLCMRSMPDIYEVVGVCEPNEKRRAFAMKQKGYDGLRWFTLDELLNEPNIDAIIVESHELEQGKDALFFLERGYHVHMDKPGGEDKDVYEKLTACAKQKNLIFQPGYMYRYNPAVRKTLELIQNGVLGDVMYTELHMSAGYGEAGIRTLESLKGGMMFYLGCHLCDLMYLIQGMPNKITALNQSSGAVDSTAKDFGFALFHYDRGVSFVKTSAAEVYGYSRRQFVIAGTNGTVEIKPIELPTPHETITNANQTKLFLQYKKDGERVTETLEFDIFGRYDDMMRDFAEIVAGEKQNPFSPDYELTVYNILRSACGLEE